MEEGMKEEDRGTGRREEGRLTRSEEIPSNIVSVFCGCYHTGVITKLGSLYMWGVRGRTGAGRDPRSRQDPPSIKWRGPLWRHEKIWELIVLWLFLGREDAKSNLSRLPIEVVFNFTTVLLDIKF
jgi:hypothetical protein